jgi:hypothetical protein
MRNGHTLRFRVETCDLRLDKAYAAVEHRGAEVERDIFGLAQAEGEANQRRVEDKLTAVRNERYLMFLAKRFSQTLCGDNTAEAAAQDKYVCHIKSLLGWLAPVLNSAYSFALAL